MPTFINDSWIYDSTLVNGYVEKYSNRDMRRRNARLMKRYAKTSSPEEKENIKHLLIENNLPLAMHIALRYRHSFISARKSIDDLFQEGCIGLTKAILNELDPSYNQKEFQTYLAIKITSSILSCNNTKTFDSEEDILPFDELAYTPGETPVPNREFIKWLIDVMPCSERDKTIFKQYWFGDEKHYILAEDTEDIAFYHNLTRARILQILKKTMKKFRKYVFRLLDNTDLITREDFYIG